LVGSRVRLPGGVFHTRRASGILRFERARMSEDAAQGPESELQNARGRRISKLSPNTSNLNSIHEIKQSDA
jgi:hypothetical protein